MLRIQGTGTVVEVRELKTKTDNKVWRRVLKVKYEGGASELVITEDLARLCTAGDLLEITGTIEADRNGQISLVVTDLKPLDKRELLRRQLAELEAAEKATASNGAKR